MTGVKEDDEEGELLTFNCGDIPWIVPREECRNDESSNEEGEAKTFHFENITVIHPRFFNMYKSLH